MFKFLKSLFSGKAQDNNNQEIDNVLKNLRLKEAKNDIEKLFLETFDDIHKVEDFCKLFRETEFYILGEIVGAEQINKEEGSLFLNKKSQLKLPVFNILNEPMNIFFTSREKFEEAVKDKEYNKYILCKFGDIINEPEHSFIMNPGYALHRVFDPNLMKSILKGENVGFDTPSFSELADDDKIYIGIPPKKPEKLVDALLKFSSQNEVFESIVVAQLKDKKNGTRLCVGVEFMKDIQNKASYYGEMINTTRGTFDKGEYIDFVEKGDGLGDLVFKHGVRIF